MKKLRVKIDFPLLLLIISIYSLSNSIFELPPIGKFINPFIGIVQNNENINKKYLYNELLKNEMLDSVNVYYDTRKVPHIFTKTDYDLYFMQGYITATHRLWQMDFISYAAAGRLSEIFTQDSFLEHDINQRRLGILNSAQKSLVEIKKNRETITALTAYTNGVNAYINSLSYKNIPFEYKLLDYEVEKWSNLKSILILKQLGNTLTGYDQDAIATKLLLALGEEKFSQLFPEFTSENVPIINNNPKFEMFKNVNKQSYINYSFISSNCAIPKSTYNPNLGSNSWIVSGKKTKSGYPILCNDPHLNLSLPCTWFEMQLSSPNMNVYGVTIPGTPSIIIGFNNNIAWGLTNGADDVKDWYKLQLNSEYSRYQLDNKWLKLKRDISIIKRKERSAYVDTIYSTIHGPIVSTKSFSKFYPEHIDHALKWEIHNPSNEFLVFINLNKAKNYEEFKMAIKDYSCPIQNFSYADKNNNIALHHQGKIALKWSGQGKFLLDGTKSSHLYKRYIPIDSLPKAYNPDNGFLLSANQKPTDRYYPYYYNGYFTEVRANRIKYLLTNSQKVNVEMMKSMQLDVINSFAEKSVPILLNSIRKSDLKKNHERFLYDLHKWKYSFDSNSNMALFFHIWMENISAYMWDEIEIFQFGAKIPDEYVLLDLVKNDPCNSFFDKLGTNKKECAADIITQSFITSFNKYNNIKLHQDVSWSNCNRLNILHLSNISAFSRMNIPSDGYSEVINASAFNWGPSWRMIVEFGKEIHAYGIYPGGQSGNIGSVNYDNFIDDWIKGKYYSLNFYLSENDAKINSVSHEIYFRSKI